MGNGKWCGGLKVTYWSVSLRRYQTERENAGDLLNLRSLSARSRLSGSRTQFESRRATREPFGGQRQKLRKPASRRRVRSWKFKREILKERNGVPRLGAIKAFNTWTVATEQVEV